MNLFALAHVNVCLALIILVHAENFTKSEHSLAEFANNPSNYGLFFVIRRFVIIFGRTSVPHSSLTSNITDIENYFADLNDQSSILEKANFGGAQTISYPTEWILHSAPLLEKKSSGHLERVTNSIVRVLNFIEHHLDLIEGGDIALSLSFAKIYDDKHGGYFQNTFDFTRLTSQACSQQSIPAKEAFCRAMQSDMKPHHSRYLESTLVPYIKSVETPNVGKEADPMHGRLNGICQGDLMLHCQVNKECEEKYFAPEPSTQYMLTHQLLQRIFAESKECEVGKRYLNETVNHRLCAKMYAEAQLVSYLKYPELLRDIFAEYVGLCGYMGYPNFYREDWLDAILSWQSKSEYGCFIQDDGFDERYFTSDVPLKRRETKEEIADGVQSKELCRPHFTTVNLLALLGYWDYLMDQN